MSINLASESWRIAEYPGNVYRAHASFLSPLWQWARIQHFTFSLPNLHHGQERATREITFCKQQGVPSRIEAKPLQEQTLPDDLSLKLISFFSTHQVKANDSQLSQHSRQSNAPDLRSDSDPQYSMPIVGGSFTEGLEDQSPLQHYSISSKEPSALTSPAISSHEQISLKSW